MDEFEKLYESHIKAQAGVTWKDSVARFSLHGIEEVLKLYQQLRRKTYRQKPPAFFTVNKPKKREILAIAYRDRVYQRNLNDNILYPVMTKPFVYENAACQKGRGTQYAMDLLKRNLRRFYINHGTDGYVLQVDVKGYYPSMPHEKVLEMFRKKLPEDVYPKVEEALKVYPGDTGYKPGSQMVQIAGISYLNGIDHFIKEKLHIRNYVRVMDDMVLIHEDKEYLEKCRVWIEYELSELGLETHPKKTKIVPVTEGILFLGFKWRLTSSGKVILTPKKETVKDFRRTLEKLMRMMARGERTKTCVEKSAEARLAHLANGNTRKLRRRLDQWCHERMRYYERKSNRFLQPAINVPR